MNNHSKLRDFDPNGTANTGNNIFGLPFGVDDSRLVFIPVPWDVTTSNHQGTHKGPGMILQQSYQIDLYDPSAVNAWQEGMAMEPIDTSLVQKNHQLRSKAEQVITFLESGKKVEDNKHIEELVETVNTGCSNMIAGLEHKCLQYIANGQLPFLVGGDHSVSTGLIRALARHHDHFGILQIDAHADMRNAYQGFLHSHASVMHHAMLNDRVSKIIQAGVREFCDEERRFMSKHPARLHAYTDHTLHKRLFGGASWDSICREIVGHLPDKLYVTFDVDGLDPANCPGTGTPVPGGLSFNQALYLLETALKSGKRFIGADLVETGPGITDGIISSRLLFRMAGMVIKSNQ